MKPQPVDVISADPRTISSRVAWTIAVVALLAAALAGAITAAVHYRGEVASLRRQLHSVPALHPPSTVPPTLSSNWAAGVTDAHGVGNLSGHALTVSLRAEYWLYLSLSSSGGNLGPGLAGGFTAAGKFSAAPARNPAC